MKYAQLVIGPAGSGKSTYCKYMKEHCEIIQRNCRVINLDPAAEELNYQCDYDIKELINVGEVMEYLNLGPNGALLYCMEYLFEKHEWIEEIFNDNILDDDFIIIDCPGQIELYSDSYVIAKFLEKLKNWDYNVLAVYCIDVSFVLDASKFLSGTLAVLTTMILLEVPHLTMITKMDLLNSSEAEKIEDIIEKAPSQLLCDIPKHYNKKYHELTKVITDILDDWSMVSFVTLNLSDESSIENVLVQEDLLLTFSENQEPKMTGVQ